MKDLSTRFSKKKRKNVRKADFDQINTGIGSVDWKKEFVGRNKHVPEKRENLRKSEKWMNYEYGKACRELKQ
ncbi:hypothetical protein BpHYR1_054279 [Brachionus plicatilis]|uniref:Uncharacterized protein n=1 Tax=Brachionus plicatilis TaxID=10195 RepID=A0A3M7S4G4_BRAPC|nr:hypothetical protein BpHYR1_054279 [Brachionus plicatilis]